ncbi:MAG: type IV pilus modification protein PilV [Methylobacillus sp.]|jgi:type IV pilus assembly protein PilV|nr:type IV pilus modification protein PilV [Methylobacillus sp.]
MKSDITKSTNKKSGQRGFALIEALISLLILVLGVLALAQVQARMLVETRTSNSRATAIRLIGDLADRVRLNAAAHSNGASPYASTSANDFSVPTLVKDCGAAAATCSLAEQAGYDVWFWQQEVKASLMNGSANIYQIGPQQLRVVVAWQANEKGATDTNANIAGTLQITGTNAADRCNTGGMICHVDFIDIPTH